MLQWLENKKVRSVVITCCFSWALTACGGGGNSGGDNEAPAESGPTVGVQTPAVQGEQIPPGQEGIIATENSRAYRSGGTYSAVLKECALADFDNLCLLSKLPYVGQTTTDPVVEDIMQRVVVTHDWMGVRFEQMLRRLPADIIGLFAPVTSVVIGSDVRPSSFSAIRGRIRLDPRYLWMTVPEKRTISTAADFRSEYGASLQFVSRSRSMIGDEYAVRYWSLTDDSERPIEELDIALARLLYHELAHANDYIQTDKVAGLSLDQTPSQAVDLLVDTRVSELLYADVSLSAPRSLLYGLGAVRYFDDEPSEFQKSVLADTVGATMDSEGKTIFYAYSTIREDAATLFEAAMIKFHYQVDTHVGFANKPADYPDSFCNDYKVAWGVRNRLASPLVAPRAQFVTDKMLPRLTALDSFFSGNLGQAVPLRVGDGWCDSRTANPMLAKGKAEGLEWTMTRDYE